VTRPTPGSLPLATLPRKGGGLKNGRDDMNDDKKSWHDSLPFPKRWLGYIVLKIIVLALAIYVVLKYNGLL
jgi:hypothetical protein